jgi:CheY-like chemotaxis protein
MMPTRILVADDEEFIVDLLATLLEDEGHTVFRAYDGVAALAIAVRERPTLILSDVMMPHLTGLELVARLRAWEDGSGPPVILLSAVASPLSPLPPRTMFIAKPFDLDAVLAAVAALLPATE